MKHQRGKAKIVRFPRESQPDDVGQTLPKEANTGEARRELVARKGTGPRTKKGKERTKYNALSHGLTTRRVLRWESEKEYDEFLESWREDWQPVGAYEEDLVEKLVEIAWCRRRWMPAMNAEILKSVQFLESELEWEQRMELQRVNTLSVSESGGLLQYGQNPMILKRCIELLGKWGNDLGNHGFTPDVDHELLSRIYGDREVAMAVEFVPASYYASLGLAESLLEEVDEEEETEDSEKEDADSVPAPEGVRKGMRQAIVHEIERLTQLLRTVEGQQAQRLRLEAQTLLVPPASERFMRHATALDRLFDKMVNQLERAQCRRRGEKVLPLIKVDVSK